MMHSKMSNQVINADLLRERSSATFRVETLTNLLDGGAETTRRRRAIQQRALGEKVFTEGPADSFLAREQLYERSIKKAVHANKLIGEWNLDHQEIDWMQAIAFPNESAADNLHTGMFLPTLENQCTEEQKKRWLPKAYRREYLGTYSQTELGHGTHLRKLETTATYDPKTEEFVIHSPTTSAMKWWPGGQGKTANCAVVMAQLYSQGVNHGIHPFFVVFRDLHTHQPLPRISVGDIGPKFGFNTIDNGFLKFDQFRIPRENMLMKHSEVLKDGTFIKKTQQKKATYSTMTMVRTYIVHVHGYSALAAGITIAIRYSAVRRQSELKPNTPEPQILDYQTQQYKLLPYLAMSYSFKFAFNNLLKLYLKTQSQVKNGNYSSVAELHALSSGLKAYTTFAMAKGMEQARMSCGGHGYSQASGFPKLYTTHVPAITFEGENTVLLLQTARFLVKCVGQSRNETLPATVQYLSEPNKKSQFDASFHMEHLQEAFQHRARRIVKEVHESIQQLVSKGVPEYDARNRNGVHLTRAAIAHTEQFIISSFVQTVESVQDESVRLVLSQLCRLLAAYLMNSQSGDFLLDGYLSPAQCQLVRDQEGALLADLRHNAVALVDAFDIPDHTLGSVLGRYDGQVYDNLYQWALASPLNDTQVHGSYYKYLQPMMKAKI